MLNAEESYPAGHSARHSPCGSNIQDRFAACRLQVVCHLLLALTYHTIPNGDPAAIFDRALTVLLADLERAKLAVTDRPRAPRAMARGSRHIPAAVKRAVWQRDDGRCAFVGTNGRCTERGFLEFHHVVPYAAGGKAVIENVELRCAPHNAYEAEQYFGPRQPSLVREVRPVYQASPTRSGPSWVMFQAPAGEPDGLRRASFSRALRHRGFHQEGVRVVAHARTNSS
jgi:hypothetical protein